MEAAQVVARTSTMSIEDSVRQVASWQYWLLLLLIGAWSRVAIIVPRAAEPKVGRHIELTKRDLFAIKNWTSLDISVLGFYLGMTRKEAQGNAIAQRLRIAIDVPPPAPCPHKNQGEDCDIFNRQDHYIGLSIHFDTEDRISRIVVEREPPAADPSVRRADVARRFKGSSHALFFAYTDALRVKLLGPESNRVLPTDRRETAARFSYSRLGVTVGADPAFGPGPAYEVTLVLFAPQAATTK
jgi:hypothetical protein